MAKKSIIALIIFLIIPVIIYSQSLTITYPNGGESFTTGDSVNVTWSTSGSVPVVDLSYSLDNGSTWEIIETNVENNGSYLWGIPLFPEDNSQCLVKVYDNDDGVPFDKSDTTFTIITTCSDPYEPNDTQQEAYPLVFSENYDGCIASPGENDWFKFASGEGGIVTARLSLDGIGSGLEYVFLYIYPLASAYTTTGEDLVLSASLAADDTFYVWIYNGENPNASATGSYRLFVEYQELECEDLNEPNDSFGEATSIAFNDTLGGCINLLSDLDYFSFVGTAGDTINVNVITEGFQSQFESYTVDLYKDSTKLIQNDISADGSNLAIVHIMQETGDYYLKIQSQTSVGEYQLIVNGEVQNTNDIRITYPNGGEELFTGDSVTITWNSSTSISFVDLSYSIDNGFNWHTIQSALEDNGSYKWGIPFLSESHSLCFIKVYDNADGIPFDYNDAEFTITASCPDPYEPNDSQQEAYPLVFSENYDGCIAFPGDNDWFKFASGDGGIVTARLSLDGIGSELEYVNLYVYPVASVYTFTGEDLELSVPIATDDTFHVWIYNGEHPEANVTGKYRLFVEYQELECEDLNEPNDSFSEATSVAYNDTVNGCINLLTDLDYFSFTGTAGDTVNVNVITEGFQSQFESYTVDLYHDSTTLIQNDISADGSNLAIVHILQETGDYYLKMQSATSVGEYQIIVDGEVRNTNDIQISYPNGGEELLTGDSVTISWNSSTSIPFVDLSYSIDNGFTWETIQAAMEDSGSYLWEVPLFPESHSLCFIKVYDNADGIPFDYNDAEFTITAGCPDPYEPNNTKQEAWPLILTETYDGCIAFPGDNDWFKFGSSDGGLITARLFLEEIGSDLEYVNMFVYPVGSAMTLVGDDLELTLDLAADDTFYVWLFNAESPASSTTGTYRLLVEYQELNYEDVNEPNDSFIEAESVKYNEAVNGAITVLNDVDYFSFTGTAGDTIFVNVLTDSIGSIFSGYSVELYKDTTTLIQQLNSTDGGNLVLVQELQEASDYYVKIYSSSSVGQYQLNISTEYVVSVASQKENIPRKFSLYQNYPNPFNPVTTIQYDLPHREYVILKVYNTLGQEIATLANEPQAAGYYRVNWDASQLGSGIYFYTIHIGDFKATKKCLFVK